MTPYVQEMLQWAEPVQGAPTGQPAVPGSKRAKLLVADDNADMRSYITGLLQDTYHVVTVVDGQAALELIPALEPDLVLADVMMPRLGGKELLSVLRGDARTRTICAHRSVPSTALVKQF